MRIKWLEMPFLCLFLLLCLFVLTLSSVRAAGHVSTEVLIKAFQEDQDIKAVYRDIGDDMTLSTPSVVMTLDSQCGGAGCSSSYLVAQKVSYRQVNPWSRTILAIVHVSPRGSISGVQRVRLVPYVGGEGKDPGVSQKDQ